MDDSSDGAAFGVGALPRVAAAAAAAAAATAIASTPRDSTPRFMVLMMSQGEGNFNEIVKKTFKKCKEKKEGTARETKISNNLQR